MAGVNHRLRQLIAAIEEAGLTVVSVRQNKHFVIRVRGPGGEASVTVPVTPSDSRRGDQNFRKFIARLAKQSPGEKEDA